MEFLNFIKKHIKQNIKSTTVSLIFLIGVSTYLNTIPRWRNKSGVYIFQTGLVFEV